MKFIKKHKKWLILPVLLFLIALYWPEKANSYSFGITYIASERMTTEDFNSLTGLMASLVKEELGDGIEINVEEITTELDEGSGRQNAMARLLYGDGVIYIAEYELVRSIVDDDELFAVLPDEIEADILKDDMSFAAKSLDSFENVKLSKEYPKLCVFIRSSVSGDKDTARYLEANYDTAVNVLLKIK